jgi:hypothetical protein
VVGAKVLAAGYIVEVCGHKKLLVFLEVILFSEGSFGFLILIGEIGFEAGAEVDVPAPDAA